MNGKSWYVGNGSAGCLFDSVAEFSTKQAAADFAQETVGIARDNGEKFTGNKQSGYVRTDGMYYIEVYQAESGQGDC